MPASLSFPGVYIEEVSSGVRTISGVATSITAFVGRALRGRVNEPTFITSFGDFERQFGGLWRESTLGYAVRSYFQNGGSQAIIVRVHKSTTGDESTLSVGGLTLRAANPGAWGKGLRATVELVDDKTAERLGQPSGTLFNLTVVDTVTGVTEVFRNVTHVAGHPRELKNVLARESQLVAQSGNLAARPTAGSDAVSVAERALASPPTDAQTKALADAREKQGGSDGDPIDAATVAPNGGAAAKTGLFALLKTDLFNILNIPPLSFDNPDLGVDVVTAAVKLCEDRRAMLVLDPPKDWVTVEDVATKLDSVRTTSKNAAVYFPRLQIPDPLREGQLVDLAPGGAVAGVFARIDAARGVWKAPAGLEANLVGAPALSLALSDLEIGRLNQLGVNCLRTAPAAGRVVWGARTREGDDRLASEWKYVPIRRLALFIEESLFRGTQWVVFEPNDEPLWSQIRLNLGAFMQGLFRQGAFQGKTPREAYFVKVDRETTTQADINRGVVNILVGFAPLKPAEFVVLKIQQIAGSLAG